MNRATNTSKQAYKAVKRRGKLKSDYKLILDYIGKRKTWPTRSEISNVTNIPINIVTPRVNELLGHSVTVAGRRRCRITGYYAQVLALKVAA